MALEAATVASVGGGGSSSFQLPPVPPMITAALPVSRSPPPADFLTLSGELRKSRQMLDTEKSLHFTELVVVLLLLLLLLFVVIGVVDIELVVDISILT